MAGFDNEVVFARGEKLQASTAQDILLMQSNATDISRINYTGNPNGSVSANPSSICHDPVTGIFYVKTSGTGNTGWEVISTASGTVTSVSGTANRITSTGGTTPVIDIAATYIGQNSITTLGTVTTGTWNATTIGETYGGTAQSTWTAGDLLYASAPNTLSKLAATTNGFILTLVAGLPAWAANGTGDVTGPGSSTDNALVRFDGLTGKIIQNGVVTEDDTGNISQSAAVSGASLSIITSNTSNTASASAYHQCEVAGATASDAYYLANISGGQNWSFGLDNSDSDAFVLAASSSLGTTNVMRSSTAGEINFPLQPAFLAYNSATITNATGDGTLVSPIAFNAEIFDQNSDYDTSTYTFTAPVSGRYNLECHVLWNDVTASVSGSYIQCVTSNRNFTNNGTAGKAFNSASQYHQFMTAFGDMDLGDTFIGTCHAGGTTKTVDIAQGGSTDLRSWLSGVLIC